MRSARTDRRTPAIDQVPPAHGAAGCRGLVPGAGLLRSSVVRVYPLLALALLLTGCAGGAAEEARRAEAREAATTPQLAGQQATRIAQRFFPPTPTPGPTPPPVPALDTLAITLGVDGAEAPQGHFATVPSDAGTLYAAAHLNDVAAGQVVTATWVDGVANTIATSEVEIDGGGGSRWVALPLTLNGSLPPGEYAVFLFVDDRRLGSLLFGLTPPGSFPQQLPDPPQNPTVDRGIPGAGQTPGPNDPNRRRDGQSQGQPVPQDPFAQNPNGAPPAAVIVDPNQIPPEGGGNIVPVTVTP